MAQNASETADESDRTSTANQKKSPESANSSKDGSASNTPEVETKRVKPFRPSEEIAAEQAVDFPWDI